MKRINERKWSKKWYCDVHAVGLRSRRYLVTTNGCFFGIRSEKVPSLRSVPRLCNQGSSEVKWQSDASVWRLPEPPDSKIWSWVLWDSEPRITVLAMASSNLAVSQLSGSLRRRASEVSWVCRRSWAVGRLSRSCDSVVRVSCNCKRLCCDWLCVTECNPINPVVNPNSVLYSRRTRDNTKEMIPRWISTGFGTSNYICRAFVPLSFSVIYNFSVIYSLMPNVVV
jgi:hypothetical protein